MHLALLRPHAAARDFSRAVEADARFSQGYLKRAQSMLMTGSYSEAIEDLSRAVAFDVNNAEIYSQRGEAYLAVREIPAALKDFSQAIAIDPRHVRAYQGRGLAHAYANSFDEAFADLNRAIELDPRSARAFAFRAFVYKQTGQVGVGGKDIETALKLDEKSGEVLWAKAEIEEAQGRTEQAIADAKQALLSQPGLRDAIDLLRRVAPDRMDDSGIVIAGAATAPWRVIRRGAQYEALSDDYPRLAVPMEMIGEGSPKIIAWEEKAAPHEGFAVLRFSAGTLTSAQGKEEVEMAALIDLTQQTVLSVVPNRQGDKTSNWSWEDTRVTIAALDGVNEEIPLNPGGGYGAMAGAAGAAVGAGTRRLSTGSGAGRGTGSGGAWAPWNQPFGMPNAGSSTSSKTSKSAQKRKKKPKSFFELLFN